MDEAASQHPKVLGNDRKRRPHPDILRHHGVLSEGHCLSRLEPGLPCLRDSPDYRNVTHGHKAPKRPPQ